MLEFCGRKFICDECPICKGIEHRLNPSFLSVVIVAMLLKRLRHRTNGVGRKSLEERIDARHGNGKRKS